MESSPMRISRTGVYAVAVQDGKILLVTQQKGPYAGKFDLPGGGIEFGETIEEALRRELQEEVGMDFISMEWMANLTAHVTARNSEDSSPYEFYQIGLIYVVEGLFSVSQNNSLTELRYDRVDLQTLKQDVVSPFVWSILQKMNQTANT